MIILIIVAAAFLIMLASIVIAALFQSQDESDNMEYDSERLKDYDNAE